MFGTCQKWEAKPFALTPLEEAKHGVQICCSGIVVLDVVGEERGEAFGGLAAGRLHQCWQLSDSGGG